MTRSLPRQPELGRAAGPRALDYPAIPVNVATDPEPRAGKRMFDASGATLALAATAIPMLGLYILVLWDLGSPVIFRQVRLGRGQHRFVMYKFRSMTDARDARGDLLPDDRCTTRLGQFLRRSRLDELPELFNILRGDMSFIGPRPLPPADAGSGWLALERCRVRPGLTGWAQVNGNTFLSTGEKFALDIWYVRYRSVWIDLKILVKTIDVVIRGERRNHRAIRNAVQYAEYLGRNN